MHKYISWLVAEDFLGSVAVENREHFQDICRHIYNFISHCPTPILVFLDKKNVLFHFRIGDNSFNIPYFANMSKYDFIRLVTYWAESFYPRYSVLVPIKRKLRASEISEILLSSENANEEALLDETISENYLENFMIEKCILRDDQMICHRNDERQLRISTIPLSILLKKFRQIPEQAERKKFIDGNTRILNTLDGIKSIDIKYEGKELQNFFKAWIPLLHSTQVVHRELYKCKWDKFNVFFSNEQQIRDLIKMKENYESEYGSVANALPYMIKTMGISVGKWNYSKERKYGNSRR